ncbi:MAG: hypothetical protein AAFV97_00740 [Bacteroidota bacterium]
MTAAQKLRAEGIAEGRAEGIEQGRREAQQEVLRAMIGRMHQEELDVDTIAHCIGLSVTEVQSCIPS